MRKLLLRAWVLCWLTLVWMLLWGNVSAANVLSGLAVALVITQLLPLPAVPIEGKLHPVSLLRLAIRTPRPLARAWKRCSPTTICAASPPRSAPAETRLPFAC